MAAPTRLYLGGTAAAINCGSAVNASGLGSVWASKIGTIVTNKLVLTADATLSIASNVTLIGNGSNPNDVWYASYLTDVLPNGKVINGNIQGTALAREGNANLNGFPQCAIYVVDSGGSLLATLKAAQTSGGTEYNSPSANNRMFPRDWSSAPGPALSSYTTVNGTSRILIEMGTRVESTNNQNGYLYIGDNGGSDLPTGDGNSNSTTANPWFEFSIDLFSAPAGAGAKARVGAIYG